MEIQSWPQTNSQSSRTSSSSASSPSSSTSSSPTNTHIQINFLNKSSKSSSTNSPKTSFSLKIPSSLHSHKDQENSTPSPQISYLAVQETNSLLLLYAASFNQITVFNLSNFTLTDTFGCKNPSSGVVKSISFLGNKKIFTAHQDGKIRVWQVITNETSSSSSSSSSKMKHRLISTLPTLKHRLWRGLSSKNYVQIRRHEQKLWIQHADAVSGLAVTEDRLLMYSISWDRSFKTWKLTSSDTDPCCTESVNNAHSDAINAIVVSPRTNNNNNVTVYTASADGCIKVWENSKSEGKKKHKLLTTLDNGHNSRSVNAMVLNKDGSVLFSGGSDSNILAWEIIDINYNPTTTAAAADRVGMLSGHKGPVLCLIYEGDFLISGSSDRTVRIWKKNNNGYCCVAVLEGHTKAVKSLAAIISSTNNYYNNNIIMSIFSGSLDGEIKVWKVNVTNFD